MLLQYEESDWVFLRRLCSHFGGYLMTDAADSCGRVYFGTFDEQNSTAYITGMEGEIRNRYQYDAFGAILDYQEKISNRILYTGQQYDQTSGQYYLKARYYNPVVSRFLQEDVNRGDGLNLYAYCADNPVVYYDDSGDSKKKIIPGAKGGTYNHIDANGGQIHHMPADSISVYGTDAGPGIWMETEDHMQTASWGRSEQAIEYRTRQEELIRQGKFKEAQEMDIKNIRELFGDKYDDGIAEMEQYTDQLLKKRPIDKEFEKKKRREERKRKKEEERKKKEEEGKCS